MKSIARTTLCLLVCILCVSARGMAGTARVTLSRDGTPISYDVRGSGEPTLVFVHGWSCDARYWQEQLPVFAKDHRVIAIDLAGHGHSGLSRNDYTMQAFGEDIKAVMDAVHVQEAILIGHSMGGRVIAEAAKLMPGRVIGMIGVDTLQNVEYPLTQEALDAMTAPLNADFPSGCKQFVESMLKPDPASPELREWILADMASAPDKVALSAVNNMLSLYITGEFAAIFDDLDIPVVCVNADMWPEDAEANRRHMSSYESITVTNADHFLHLNRPDAFNPALKQAISQITAAR
ncbi:MAG: alpha/beta hydrolase [Spartobacteria bacterium]|nr:alpha/beta hydrolase [Spartobacteria bacterium]